MADLTVHAIGIDELRALFSGAPERAAELRELAAATFTAPPRPSVGLLDKLGPLTGRPVGAPVVRPGVPTAQDLADVLAGRDVAPQRLPAAWRLVGLWLDDRSWGRLQLTVDRPSVDDLDFELGSLGVPPSASLAALFRGALALPLRNGPGQVTGYLRHARARALRDAWRPVLGQLTAAHAETAQQVVTWLGGLEEWADRAAAVGRPAPDLVSSLVDRGDPVTAAGR